MGLSAERLQQILREGLPRAEEIGLLVEEADQGTCRIRLPVNEQFLRPGGTISGPTMMGLADAAMWISVMSVVGDVQLAVTTNFNINFLRKPSPADLIAEGETLKIGARLAVLSVTIYSATDLSEPVAHATGTYSLPKVSLP